MWECNDCYNEFEKPIFKKIEFEKEFGITQLFQTSHQVNMEICPICGSSNIEEMQECDYCGEWNKEDDLEDTEGLVGGGIGYLCPQCIEDCGVGI